MGGRIVLTGPAGFIGSAIATGLEANVTPLPRAVADLNDRDALTRFLRPSDVIVNAAGDADATDRSPAGLRRFRESNVDGPGTLADVAARIGAAQLIHLSSVAAMGRWSGTGIHEEMMRPPSNPYARSKLAGEQAVIRFAAEVPITILRPTSVFGEGRPLARALCRVAMRRVIPLPGGGNALVPFCYVGNVVEAVQQAIGTATCFGQTFIVGDTRSYQLREIVVALAQAFGRRPRFIPVPTWTLAALIRATALRGQRRGLAGLDSERLTALTTSVEYSIARFQAATGYVPPYPLSIAAERLAAWYQQEAMAG